MADLTKAGPQEMTATLEEVVRRRADLHQAILGLQRAAAEPAEGREEQWQAGVIAALDEVEGEIVDHIEVTERDHGLYDEIIDVAPTAESEHRGVAQRASRAAGGNVRAQGAARERSGARRRSDRRGEACDRPCSGAARQPSPARSRPALGGVQPRYRRRRVTA